MLISSSFNTSRKLGHDSTDLCRLQIKYFGDFVIQFFNVCKAFDFPRWASMSKLAVKYKLRRSRRFFFLWLQPWFWLFCWLMWRSRRNGVRTAVLWSRRDGSLRSCTNLSIAWRPETGWSIIRPFFISLGFTGIRKICSPFLKQRHYFHGAKKIIACIKTTALHTKQVLLLQTRSQAVSLFSWWRRQPSQGRVRLPLIVAGSQKD